MGKSEWLDISSAPKDGTLIQLKTKAGAWVRGAWWGGFLDIDGKECGCWCADDDLGCPRSWTDGVCWAFNEDGEPSDPPIQWRPEPPEPSEE